MDFLNGFQKRMKSVSRFAVLLSNSMQKTTWKKYGIETTDEQINVLFAVLLYVMELSLKEENCTLDDIASYVSDICKEYFDQPLQFSQSKELADFIVNTILGNDGSMMYFKAYNFEKKQYQQLSVDYIANKVVYLENGVRRTSYFLTDNGYNMILSTMELENNLKLTVSEMLFKLHLEKADYGKAVNDIKNVFEGLRIQTKKIQEAMRKIRQNALSYSVEEYREIVEENMGAIEESRDKFQMHREVVLQRVSEYEEKEISLKGMKKEEKENLNNLKIIEDYLSRALDEQQKIFSQHFTLKSLYAKELENYTAMSLVKRYNFRTELYDKVLENAELLQYMHKVFSTLFLKNVEKVYHPAKALEKQQRIRKKKAEDAELELEWEEEAYQEEQKQKNMEKMEKYRKSLTFLLEKLVAKQRMTLEELFSTISDEEKEILVPNLEIFREILIELLTGQNINITELKKEKESHFVEEMVKFQLNEMLLEIVETNQWNSLQWLDVKKAENEKKVRIENVRNEDGDIRAIQCSDLIFEIG